MLPAAPLQPFAVSRCVGFSSPWSRSDQGLLKPTRKHNLRFASQIAALCFLGLCTFLWSIKRSFLGMCTFLWIIKRGFLGLCTFFYESLRKKTASHPPIGTNQYRLLTHSAINKHLPDAIHRIPLIAAPAVIKFRIQRQAAAAPPHLILPICAIAASIC